MAEEQGGLPEELETWLDEQAEETGRDREEVLARAVTAYRLLSANEDALSGDDSLAEAATEPVATLSELEASVEALEDRLDDLETAHESDVEDVRERVVQVMRTAQSKADEDHAHEEYERRAASLTDDVEGLRDRLDDLESHVEGGFENYETILERLKESADDLEDKADRLASAVLDLRRRANDLEAADARRTAVEDLQNEANRHDVATANCGDCGSSVHVALLARPHCPHCGTVFDGVEPGRGFLGSAKLTVGEHHALEGESMEPGEAEAVFESEVDDE